MDISFVIPTIGRVDEVKAVLLSILNNMSSAYVYEVVLVDQNGDDRLDAITTEFAGKMHLKNYKVSFKGASRARNYGVQKATGEFVNFPDDDSKILPDAVTLGIEFLKQSNCQLVSGRAVDENDNQSMLIFPMEAGDIKIKDIGSKIIEFSFIARRTLMLSYPFDDTLGPGCFHGAEECFDLIYRMLKNGEKLYYNPEIKFYHPQAVIDPSLSKIVMRSFSYRCGFSKVSLKHGLYFRLLKRLALVVAYLPVCLILKPKKVRFYLAEILGIFTGMVVK